MTTQNNDMPTTPVQRYEDHSREENHVPTLNELQGNECVLSGFSQSDLRKQVRAYVMSVRDTALETL